MSLAVIRRVRIAALLVLAATSSGCGSDTPILIPPDGSPSSVAVSPSTLLLGYVGATGQLQATVTTASGGQAAGVTVSWASLDPSVATVSSAGLVTAASEGTAQVVASVLDLADTATVTVTRVPASLVVEPDTTVLTAVGGTAALTVTVRDGGGQVVADAPVTWTVADPAVAEVHADGVVTARADGTTLVTARSGAASGTAVVWVAIGPAAIDVDPDSVAFTSLAGTRQLVAVVTDDAGATLDADVTWTSADPTVATVSPGGLVTASGNGATTVRAAAGAVSASVPVRVAQRATSVVVSPAAVIAAPSLTVSFGARVEDANGFAVEGAGVTWASTDPGVATVDATGAATTLADGTTSIVASSGAVADTASLTVRAVTVAGVEITPPSVLLDVGQTAVLDVRAVDGSGKVVVPPPGVWSTSDAAVATVDAEGRVRGVGQGQSWVRLAFGSVQDSTLFTVTPDLVPAPGAFDIDLRVVGVTNPVTTPSPAQVVAVKRAEARWEALIAEDLSFGRPKLTADACGVDHPAIDEQVDDLLLLVQITDIDGVGRTFSEVTECVVRTSNGLPIVAALKLDVRDLHALEASGDLDDAVLREVTHALGFGTSAPWDLTVVGAGLDDPFFPGAQAVAAFLAAGLSAPNPVPVENVSGLGARDRRWRESVLGAELMTGTLDSGVANPLSRITLGAMADLGYTVDAEGADPFPVGMAGTVSASPRGVPLHLGSILRGPRYGLSASGRLDVWRDRRR